MTTTTDYLPKLTNNIKLNAYHINCVLSSRRCAHVTTLLCIHISFSMMISFTSIATWSTCMYALLTVLYYHDTLLITCWNNIKAYCP